MASDRDDDLEKMRRDSDVPYCRLAGGARPLSSLDIYYSGRVERGGTQKNAVIFLHGGNWRGGDKSVLSTAEGQLFCKWFVERGHAFFAVNFRLFGQNGATLEDMMDDVIRAMKWVTLHGAEYGASGRQVTLVGYSSGAHLAALVATYPQLLRKHRLKPTVISGVIGLDVPFYDVSAAIGHLEKRALGAPSARARLDAAREVMGATDLEQKKVSPADRLGSWMRHVAFLLVSVGIHGKKRDDISRRMSSRFCLRLAKNGNLARHKHIADLDHGGLIASFEARLSTVVEDFLSIQSPAADRRVGRQDNETEQASAVEVKTQLAPPSADNVRVDSKCVLEASYSRLADRRLKQGALEIYYSGLPEGCSPEKNAVIFLHGVDPRGRADGALRAAELPYFTKWFVDQGHVFFSVNFRCVSQGRVRLHEMLENAASAVRWVTLNGRKYGLQSKQVTLVGYSSGAYVAALVASRPRLLRKHRLAPSVVSAVIGLDMDSRGLGGLPGDELAGQTAQRTRSISADLGAWMRHVQFLLISTGHLGPRLKSASARLSEYFTQKLVRNGNVVEHEHFPGLSEGSSIKFFEHGPAAAAMEFLQAKELASDFSAFRQESSARRRRSNVLKKAAFRC